MSDFNKTRRGIDFYDKQVPQLIKALDKIASQLEESNRLEERRIRLDERVKIAQLKEINSNYADK